MRNAMFPNRSHMNTSSINSDVYIFLTMFCFDRWEYFARNMFWLAVLGGGLILLHVTILGILKWKRKNSEKQKEFGVLVFPRFEISLTLLALPCICQASASIIRGNSKVQTGSILRCIFFSRLAFDNYQFDWTLF